MKINILMIIPWMVTGGADRFNLDLVSKMNKEKFEFTIITTLPSTNEWRERFEKYATIYDLTTFLDMKDWLKFINYIIEKNKINLIFISNSQFGYKALPYLKAKYPKIPIVDYVHMEEWYWNNGGFSRESSISKNLIDKTFTCNENSRKVFLNRFNKKPNEVETVYIGVDEEKFNPYNFDEKEVLKEIGNENKIFYNTGNNEKNRKKVVSYICRLAHQKRPFLFFEVIKKLAEKRKDFVVIVVGDGPLLAGLKESATKSNLDDIFIFLGNYKETEKIYKISDVTVNTSIKEGLALTSYESLAMGVPVVSSDVGGQAELINSIVGITVPCMQKEKDIMKFDYKKEEIENYVYAISEVLDNKYFYAPSCRERILNGFTIKNMIDKMEKELFEIVLNPSEEKIRNGKMLSKNMDILKELVSEYFASSKLEYEWLAEEFNSKNIHRIEIKNPKLKYYEHTLEYKIKHPIVVALRKVGVYERAKMLLMAKE